MIPKTLKRLAAGTACLVGLAPLGLAQWTTETVPNPRTAIAMTATDNGKVLIAGGSPGGGVFATGDLDVFDEATGTWTSTVLPKPIRFHSAASVGTSAFFGCGLEDSSGIPNGEVYEFDTVTGVVTTHLITNGRWNGAMGAVGQYLCVVAGLDAGGGAVTEVNVYDTVAKTWSQLALTHAVQDPGVTAVGGRLLVVGGKDTGTLPTNHVQWIDPAAGTTGLEAALPEAVDRPGCATLGPKAFFGGGLVLAGAGIDSTNQLVTYDDRPGTQTAAALPVKYDGGEALAVGNRIVFGGGALGGNPTATALLLEADGSASPTTMPASVIGATGASTERAAYFGGGFLAPTFVTMTELFVYTNPDVLTVDVADIPLSLGGVANFDFHAGAGEAGKSFVLLYSASGTAPGFLFDGQLIPLNFDALVIKSISLPGAPPLYDAAGVLGADGHAEPRFDIPPGLNPGLAGISLSFCAVSYDLFAIPLVSMVSNPQSFVFTP